MGNSACAKTHLDVCEFAFSFFNTHLDVVGDFAFSFFKNYTVKCLHNENSDSQGHSKYISIEIMS